MWQNRVLNNPQFIGTFYLNIYSCDQCQEGRELTMERHLFHQINTPIKKSLRLTDCVKPWFGLDLA